LSQISYNKIFEDPCSFLTVKEQLLGKVKELITNFIYKYDVGIEIVVAALIYSDRIELCNFNEKTSLNLLITSLAIAAKFF
jgi:hypothetical protein